MSATACAHVAGPRGGMSPPYHVRRDVLGFTSFDEAPLMWPLLLNQLYAPAAVDIWLWQPERPHCPFDDADRYDA
jgi:hypothetical protein